MVSIEKNKLIEMEWRFKEWSEKDSSLVRIELETGDAADETVVRVTQSKIPKKSAAGNSVDLENYRKGWLSQVFDPLSKILGLPLKSHKLG